MKNKNDMVCCGETERHVEAASFSSLIETRRHLNSIPIPFPHYYCTFTPLESEAGSSGNLKANHHQTMCKATTSQPLLKPLSSTPSIENRTTTTTTTTSPGTKLITSCDMWNALKRNPFPICPSKRAATAACTSAIPSSTPPKPLSIADVLKFAILILFLNPSAEAVNSSSSTNTNTNMNLNQHGVQGDQQDTANSSSSSLLECYVCLPGDKTSAEAKAILNLFPIEGNYSIPDCIAFADHNEHQFLFPCPPNHKGCSRHMGPDPSLVSRNCASMGIDSCVNSTSTNTEYCFCTGSKCNGAKALPVFPSSSSSSTPHTWTDLETDDEDLLPKEDDDGVEGSGSYGPDSPSNNNGGGGSSSNRHNKGHEKWDTYPHQRKFFPSTHKNSQGNKAQSTSSSAPSAAIALPTGAHCLLLLLVLDLQNYRALRLLL